jgi:hypothetical protein
MKRKESGDCSLVGDVTRREFLDVGAGAAALGLLGWPESIGAQGGATWNQGQLVHLIPPRATSDF